MKITIEENGERGRYLAEIGADQAEMTYSRLAPDLIAIDHTGVPGPLRGRGIAQALAARAVEEARKGNWKIIPLCSFFKAQADRHPDWQDVLNER